MACAANFPIVYAVLALNSWKYYSGEQGPKAQQIHKSVQTIYS